jgi:pimeloyl-ACP methyl ester carboxylesterase
MADIVLIHGAYQGGWIWQRVVSRLTAGGHRVFAPTLDGCAERRHVLRPGISTETHGAEIAELLMFEDLHDVVLVGTSSGGMVANWRSERARERGRAAGAGGRTGGSWTAKASATSSTGPRG